MRFVTTVITIFVLVTPIYCNEGYYWREYLGKVPSDAIVAGQDNNGNAIHVGQAYIKGTGLITGRVVSGESNMLVPYGGLIVTGKFIKVLCGSPQNFFWLNATSSNLHSVVTGRGQSPVIGGHEDISVDYLYVGKASVGNEVKVGKIGPVSAENPHFYYCGEQAEGKLAQFQVLMYRKNSDSSEEN